MGGQQEGGRENLTRLVTLLGLADDGKRREAEWTVVSCIASQRGASYKGRGLGSGVRKGRDFFRGRRIFSVCLLVSFSLCFICSFVEGLWTAFGVPGTTFGPHLGAVFVTFGRFFGG